MTAVAAPTFATVPEIDAPVPCVYFLEGCKTGLIKIGYTERSVRRRWRELRLMSPDTLRLIGWASGVTRHKEAEIHHRLYRHRSHGEWFNPCREVTETIMREATVVGEWWSSREGVTP